MPTISVVKERGNLIACADPMKFLFHVPGYRGDEVVSLLAEKGIYLEMGDAYYALAILSPYNSEEDVECLIRGLNALPVREDMAPPKGAYPKTEAVYSPREAFFMETERLPLRDAKNRVAAENLTPYPPGIPIVTYGERITEEVIRAAEESKNAIGFKDGKVTVIKSAW